MAYIFDTGVIKDQNSKTILKTSEAATIYADSKGLITINFAGKKDFTCVLADIITIAGVAPSDIGDAIDKLYAVFPDALDVPGAFVKTVNNVVPDGNDNVTLTATDINAVPNSQLSAIGGANKVPLLDNGGDMTLQGLNSSAGYGSDAIFFSANGQWLNIDAAHQLLEFLKTDEDTVHVGIDGIQTGSKVITTSHTATTANEVVIKSLLDSTISGLISGISYKGSWDAATNTPTLTDGSGANGDMYKVSVAGSIDLGSGSINFVVGDHIVYFSGLNQWQRFSASEPVPANPTATIGLVAQNGSSPNFMRADAAPAINQAIAPIWTGVHTFNAANTNFGGNANVAGTLSSAANTTQASVSNTGATLNGGNNFAYVALFDSTRAANNRTAELIFINGQMQLRFMNDVHSVAVIPIAITGGQGSGITAIDSNSGLGSWTHTGNKVINGSHTTQTLGGNGIEIIGSVSGGVPAISSVGVNNNVGLQFNTKGSGGIILNASSTVTGPFATNEQAILSVGYTVATLPIPSSGLKGARAFITDGTSATPGFMSSTAGTGGGTHAIPVFCNGNEWVYA